MLDICPLFETVGVRRPWIHQGPCWRSMRWGICASKLQTFLLCKLGFCWGIPSGFDMFRYVFMIFFVRSFCVFIGHESFPFGTCCSAGSICVTDMVRGRGCGGLSIPVMFFRPEKRTWHRGKGTIRRWISMKFPCWTWGFSHVMLVGKGCTYPSRFIFE